MPSRGMSHTSDTGSAVKHGDLTQEPFRDSPAPTATTAFLGSTPRRTPLRRWDTDDALTFPEHPHALLLSAPPPSVAWPWTPPSEHPSTVDLQEPLDGPTPSARRRLNSCTLESDSGVAEKESGDDSPQLVSATEGPVASGKVETSVVERLRRLCGEVARARELKAIASEALGESIHPTPPSQGLPAEGVGPMPHPLGGVHPGYPWFPLGVPVPQVAPDLQMPPDGMTPWAPHPTPMYPGHANPAAPEQQRQKKRGQSRRGEEYEPHPATQKALEGVPESELTTLMLRNIPLNYSRDQVESLLNSAGFKGKYDFLYLPCTFSTGANQGYAFVNFSEHADADQARNKLSQFENWEARSEKKAVVCWATRQGRGPNLERWRRSSVMSNEVEECARPMCYDENGNKAPGLLTPDKEPRRPRPKKNNTNGATKSEPQLSMSAYSFPYPSYGMPAPGIWLGAC